MGGWGTRSIPGLPADPTDDEKRRAALFTASQAYDADDLRELLQALGLLDPGFHWVTRYTHAGRAGRTRINTTETP